MIGMDFRKLLCIALVLVGVMVLAMGTAITWSWSGPGLPNTTYTFAGLVGGVIFIGAGAYLYTKGAVLKGKLR